MTPEEAYKILNGEIIYKGGRTNGKRFAMGELNRVINEALEKQIPKKPVIDPVDCAEVCPNCKSTGIREDYGAPNDYCSECGQAILWESE